MEQSEIANLRAALEEVKAERDTARAETVMAFELAATHYENGFPAWDVFGQFIRDCRALTPAHAKAALAARDKATRKQALREAADLPPYDWDGDPASTFENYVFVKRDNIIALMGK